MIRTTMLGTLEHHGTDLLFTLLAQYDVISRLGERAVVRVSAHREAGAKAMVAAALAILVRR